MRLVHQCMMGKMSDWVQQRWARCATGIGPSPLAACKYTLEPERRSGKYCWSQAERWYCSVQANQVRPLPMCHFLYIYDYSLKYLCYLHKKRHILYETTALEIEFVFFTFLLAAADPCICFMGARDDEPRIKIWVFARSSAGSRAEPWSKI